MRTVDEFPDNIVHCIQKQNNNAAKKKDKERKKLMEKQKGDQNVINKLHLYACTKNSKALKRKSLWCSER